MFITVNPCCIHTYAYNINTTSLNAFCVCRSIVEENWVTDLVDSMKGVLLNLCDGQTAAKDDLLTFRDYALGALQCIV